MEFKVLSVLKKYMPEEAFTAFEKSVDFEKALNVDIEKYIKANTPKVEGLKEEAQTEVIKALGIESVETLEQLQNHIKVVSDTTTDKDKLVLEWEKKYNELNTNYETEVQTRTQLEQETKLSKEMAIINRLGVSDPVEAEFLHFKFNKSVSEEKDFNTVVAEYAKENKLKKMISLVQAVIQ